MMLECNKKEFGGLPIDKGVKEAEKKHYEALNKLRMTGHRVSRPTIMGLHMAGDTFEHHQGMGHHGKGGR